MMNYYEYILFVFLIVSFLLIVRYHIKRFSLYKCAYSMRGPWAWPIIGNALWFIGNSEDFLKNLLQLTTQYGTPSRIWLGPKLFIGISKPRDLEVIMNNSVQREESIIRFLRPLLGNGLITAHAAEWKVHRKIINPTFNQNILNSFVEMFVEHTNTLIHKLEEQVDKEEFDINKYISLNALDLICDTAMGIKMNAQIERSEYAETLHRFLNTAFIRMFQMWMHIDALFYRSPTGQQFLKDVEVICNFSKTVLKKKQEQFEKEKCDQILYQNAEDVNEDVSCPKRKAFLDHLLEINDNGHILNETQILDEINTFIGAGTDTVSTTVSFVCMMLGSHQLIQDKVYSEVQKVLHDAGGSLSYSDLPKLQYLERVIKETMRLFPPAPLIPRTATKQINLGLCSVPIDTGIVVIIIHMHRDPEIWPDPLCFDPDRFLPENVSKRHPYSYIPFGAGPRNCIGLRYAMMAMKVIAAMLVKNYEFKSSCNIETVRLEDNVVLHPVLGHNVRLLKRQA